MRLTAAFRTLFACSLLTSTAAFAQRADSTTFRPRQWGAEFSLGSDFGGVSVLRFQTSRRALVLEAGGTVTRTDLESGAAEVSANSSGGNVRLGVRWYRPVVSRVHQLFTAGILASADRTVAEQPFAERRTTTYGAGGFLNLGAIWMVAPNLSLGATWEASATHSTFDETHTDSRSPMIGVDSSGNTTRLTFGALRLRGGLYF